MFLINFHLYRLISSYKRHTRPSPYPSATSTSRASQFTHKDIPYTNAPLPPLVIRPSPSPNLISRSRSSLSLFDGECGYWKALSTFLVVGVGLTGLAILFRVWPLPLSLFPADATSRLHDPDFISSVIEQATDISRILMAISDATANTGE